MKRVRTLLCTAMLACLPALGCDRAVREIVRGTLIEPLEKPELKPAKDAQIRAFVDTLMQHAEAGDAAAIAALIHWPTVIQRALAGLRVDPEYVAGLERGASEAAVQRGVPASLASVGQGKAELKYLGSETHHGETWQTFRLRPEDGGFEHLSFLVGLDPQGAARVMDIEMMTAGEPSSATMRRMMLPLVAHDKDSVLARLAGKEAAFVKSTKTMVEAQKAGAEGKAKQALAMFDKLPPDLRKEKWLMIQRVLLAAQVDDATYLKAIEALKEAHPNDPATAVHAIDGYLLAKRYDDALKAVETVERGSARDAYFDYLRGNILLNATRYPEARSAAQQAIIKEPGLVDAYWLLVTISLRTHEFDETTRLLAEMRQKFALSYQLESAADYAEYVKSPEYERLKLILLGQ